MSMSNQKKMIYGKKNPSPDPPFISHYAIIQVVGSPTNDTLVGFGKGSGVGNENQEGWSSSQEEDQGLEFEE